MASRRPASLVLAPRVLDDNAVLVHAALGRPMIGATSGQERRGRMSVGTTRSTTQNRPDEHEPAERAMDDGGDRHANLERMHSPPTRHAHRDPRQEDASSQTTNRPSLDDRRKGDEVPLRGQRRR
jgi:hypothetical protein